MIGSGLTSNVKCRSSTSAELIIIKHYWTSLSKGLKGYRHINLRNLCPGNTTITQIIIKNKKQSANQNGTTFY